ncbi:hypothetical protein WS45_29730 [Burkholderia sp. RF2-non_BP3]|nr:hypothetical protein WS45_29730 [Burkholderia sp. RF2-non_BP3]
MQFVRHDASPAFALNAECKSVEGARDGLRAFPLAHAGLVERNIIPLGRCLLRRVHQRRSRYRAYSSCRATQSDVASP